ncbi:MAG: glucokinase [Hyphomicrobium sp.]|nr:glucokinase [Hyphomicrobium sp.]
MTGWRLVCDIGGTNIRMARCEGPKKLVSVTVRPTKLCSSFQDTILDYCRAFDDHDRMSGAAIAAAGPVEAGRVTLTNHPMTIDREAVTAGLNGKPVALLNDIEATAYAVPLLSADDIAPVVAASNPKGGPRLVVNVGTGFGAALLIETPSGWQSVATEAGHMTFAALEDIDTIKSNVSKPVSVEDKLSGLALSTATNVPFGQFSAAFTDLFGAVCGNLVLATGAWGGVYLCGSVASAWCRTGDLSSFRAAFQDKGLMSDRMARVEVSEIVLPHPALVGLTTIELS